MNTSDLNGTAPSKAEVPNEFKSPESLRTLANFLRSNMKTRAGVVFDKRVDYFKGKRFVECLLESKKWPKSLPKVEDKAIALAIGEYLLNATPTLFHRCDKVNEQKGILRVS